MKDFENGTLVQKLKIIEDVIDKEVREFLKNDGGDVTILDIKEENEKVNVFVRYSGACSGCGGAIGTLFAIENILQEKISKNISVQLV